MKLSDLTEWSDEERYQPRRRTKVPTRTLRRGMTLYHGTDGDWDDRSPSGPSTFIWVRDSDVVAEWFSTWRGTQPSGKSKPRVITYELTRSVKLALFDSKDEMDAVFEMLGHYEGAPNDTEEMAEIICGAGYDGWIIPSNYQTGADILICDPGVLKYVNTYPPKA